MFNLLIIVIQEICCHVIGNPSLCRLDASFLFADASVIRLFIIKTPPIPVVMMVAAWGVASKIPPAQSQVHRHQSPNHHPAMRLPDRDGTSLRRVKTPPDTREQDASCLIAIAILRQPQRGQEEKGFLVDSGQAEQRQQMIARNLS